MIQTVLLKEKYRIQKKLAGESSSVQEYLENSHLAAKVIAKKYGFSLKYAEMTNKPGHKHKVFEQTLKQ